MNEYQKGYQVFRFLPAASRGGRIDEVASLIDLGEYLAFQKDYNDILLRCSKFKMYLSFPHNKSKLIHSKINLRWHRC